jgi:predicted acylesterase/phospholipase RssA
LIAEILGEKEMAAIAQEHRKGRRLLVMTTDLDAQKPVVWDIGAIACSGRTNALKVIHEVLLASSSIPVVFPPVLFKVEAGGAPYDELHVDGGVMAQVFGGMVLLTDAVQKNPGVVTDFYLVRNGRLSPDYEATQRKLGSIAGRSISTMMKIQGVNDVMRLWALCRFERGNFHYVSIPEDFKTELKEPFDTEYMKALFKVGYDQGRSEIPWQAAPAGLDEVERRLGALGK